MEKEKIIQLLFAKLEAELSISPQDIEITILETPRSIWRIRGLPEYHLALFDRVEV